MKARPAGTRPRARRGEGERLRAEILAAAAHIMVERGTEEALSIRAVAEAVGVTPPSIYLHFADKNDLVHAVCRGLFGALHDAMEQAVGDIDDPVEELRARARAYVRFGQENPEPYRILFTGRAGAAPASFQDDALREAAGFFRLVDNVGRAMKGGGLAGADPFLVATQLWVVVHGLTSLLISRPGFPWPPGLLDELLETCLRGLAPQPS